MIRIVFTNDMSLQGFNNSYDLKNSNDFLYKIKTLFSLFLHISDPSPVMIITYTQKPRVTVLLSSKKQTWAFAILKFNIGQRPLLVDEGGALTLCL